MKKVLVILSAIICSVTFFQPTDILLMAIDDNSEDSASSEQDNPESEVEKKKEKKHKKKKKHKNKNKGKKKKGKKSPESSDDVASDGSTSGSADSAGGKQDNPKKKKKHKKKKKKKNDTKFSESSESSDSETNWKNDVAEASLGDGVANPIVDSSQFKFDPVKIEAQPIAKLAHRVERIKLDEKLLDKSSQLIASNDVDDKIEKISQKTGELEHETHDSGVPITVDQPSVRVKHRRDPKESVRLRQELEKYRQKIYGDMRKNDIQA
ncbi:MAG: hypothetical protein LBF54_00880 [Holosporaceae bacterium]|nr:hypothetical protein [Holosporaceae bacterium]